MAKCNAGIKVLADAGNILLSSFMLAKQQETPYKSHYKFTRRNILVNGENTKNNVIRNFMGKIVHEEKFLERIFLLLAI